MEIRVVLFVDAYVIKYINKMLVVWYWPYVFILLIDLYISAFVTELKLQNLTLMVAFSCVKITTVCPDDKNWRYFVDCPQRTKCILLYLLLKITKQNIKHWRGTMTSSSTCVDMIIKDTFLEMVLIENSLQIWYWEVLIHYLLISI